MNRRVSVWKYVRIGRKWRYCKPAVGKNGKIKPDWVIVRDCGDYIFRPITWTDGTTAQIGIDRYPDSGIKKGHTSAGKKFGCAFGGRLPGMKMVEPIPQTPSVTLHLDRPPISDIEHENHEHDYQDTSTHPCQKSGL
jgi:hypothetical protein